LLPSKERRRLLRIAEHVQLAQSDVLAKSESRPVLSTFPWTALFHSDFHRGKPMLEVAWSAARAYRAQDAFVLTQPLHAVVFRNGTRVPIGAFQRSSIAVCLCSA
jgi:hypothetical protein